MSESTVRLVDSDFGPRYAVEEHLAPGEAVVIGATWPGGGGISDLNVCLTHQVSLRKVEELRRRHGKGTTVAVARIVSLPNVNRPWLEIELLAEGGDR